MNGVMGDDYSEEGEMHGMERRMVERQMEEVRDEV